MNRSITIQIYIDFLLKQVINKNFKMLPIFTQSFPKSIKIAIVDNNEFLMRWDAISSVINPKTSKYKLYELLFLLHHTQQNYLLLNRLFNIKYSILNDQIVTELINCLSILFFIIDDDLYNLNIYLANIEFVAKEFNKSLFIKYKKELLENKDIE